MKKISVINLCFNTGERLIDTLNSIANQTFKDFEIIIVDDASTDNSVEILEKWIMSSKYIDVKLIKNKKNAGIPVNLNRVLQIACGEYISVIGDDIWSEFFLEALYSRLKNLPQNIGMIYCKAKCFDKISGKYWEDLDPIVTLRGSGCSFLDDLFVRRDDWYFISKEYSYEGLFWANYFISFCFLARKSAILSCNGYDESYLIEDYPFWFKLTKKYDICYLDKSYGTYLRHIMNFSTNLNPLIDIDTLKLYTQHFRNIRLDDTRKKVQNAIYLLLQRIMANSGRYQKKKAEMKLLVMAFIYSDFKSKFFILRLYFYFFIKTMYKKVKYFSRINVFF